MPHRRESYINLTHSLVLFMSSTHPTKMRIDQSLKTFDMGDEGVEV